MEQKQPGWSSSFISLSSIVSLTVVFFLFLVTCIETFDMSGYQKSYQENSSEIQNSIIWFIKLKKNVK